MKDYLRESLSYFGLYRKMFRSKKKCIPAVISYGGYRLSPKYKYPCQIKDVCTAFKFAISYLKDYDRRNGEPVALMNKSHIPMLLIQSKHDGLIDYRVQEVL